MPAPALRILSNASHPVDRLRRLPAVWLLALFQALAALVPGVAGARQTEAPGAASASASSELKRLSIEELMEIDVTSVSKRPEKLSSAAAAISVVTGDDIRRAGVTNLPDALRLVPGLEVAQLSGTTWGIAARGFNNNAVDKLLVLIDGRSIYTPLFSGVFWDAQDILIPDIDRIEVIRGPGATLWGANAVNGVINIITKSSADTQGGLAVAGAGKEEPAFGTLRYGGRIGEEGTYRAYGKYYSHDALALPRGTSASDPLRRSQGGFRSDWTLSDADAVTLQGDLYSGHIAQADPTGTDLDGQNLLGRWSHRFAPGSDLNLQVYFDRTHRITHGVFAENRDTFDVDLQHHWKPGTSTRQDVLWGVGYRATSDQVGNSPLIFWDPPGRTLDLVNAFAQDEVTLPDEHLHLTLGSKLEYNSFTHFEVQPSVRLAWTPDDQQTLWGAISRAVRIPAQIDEDVRFTSGPVVTLAGSHDFKSEKLLAYELGYRVQPGGGLSLDAAAFYNSYDHLRSQELQPDGSILLANKLTATTWGGEVTANYQMTSWWRWSGTYTYLHKNLRLLPGSLDPTGGAPEGNDPTAQATLRSSLDLPHRLELDAWLRHVDRLPAPLVPAYTELDLRLGWRLRSTLELSLAGRNLLHGRHPEWGAPSPLREEVRRTLYGKIEWHF
ncbi:MAG: TonB-dependent receptor [Acidobacteriota bacterium]|nr:TonB-dependent receptor [Acidobacteriota bacterium]